MNIFLKSIKSQPLYYVKVSAAQMPSNCYGKYKRVALVKIKNGSNRLPIRISPLDKSVDHILMLWDKVNVGITSRSAYSRVLTEAMSIKNRLNKRSYSFKNRQTHSVRPGVDLVV